MASLCRILVFVGLWCGDFGVVEKLVIDLHHSTCVCTSKNNTSVPIIQLGHHTFNDIPDYSIVTSRCLEVLHWFGYGKSNIVGWKYGEYVGCAASSHVPWWGEQRVIEYTLQLVRRWRRVIQTTLFMNWKVLWGEFISKQDRLILKRLDTTQDWINCFTSEASWTIAVGDSDYASAQGERVSRNLLTHTCVLAPINFIVKQTLVFVCTYLYPPVLGRTYPLHHTSAG